MSYFPLTSADGSIVINADGTVSIAGKTVGQLTTATLGSATHLIASDGTGFLDTTAGALLTWMLQNDGSVDISQATVLTTLPAGLVLFGMQTDGTIVRVPVGLTAGQAQTGGTGGTGGTTPVYATTYSITTAATGTVGTAQIVTVAVIGTLGSAVVVGLVDDASGVFVGTVTLAAGSNSSSSAQYTPASAGARTITGTNNGGLTNPNGRSVTVAAAVGGGTTNYPAATLTGATFGPAMFGNGLTSGKVSGTVPGGDIVVLSATVNFGTAPANPSPYAMVFGFVIGGKSYGFSMGDSLDFVYADYAGNNQSGHTFQNGIWDNQPRQVQIVLNRVTPYGDHPGTSHVNFIINGQSFRQDDIPAFATGDTLAWSMDKTGLGQGGYVDNIELLNSYDGLPSAVPSTPAARTSKTIYIYSLNVDGTGS